jgi:hypothetical protein
MTRLSPCLLALALLSAPALADPQCGPRDALVALLADRYGETRRSVGLARDAVVEVFASEVTGSWTIAVTLPDGTMCLLAAGENFEAVNEGLPARGEKA